MLENIVAWLENLNGWIKIGTPAVGVIVWAWKFYLKDKYSNLMSIKSTLDRVPEALTTITDIRKELSPNGGLSLKDSVSRIELQLRLQDQKILALIKIMQEGVWLADNTGKIIDVNRYLCNIYNRTETDLLGNNWTKWIVEKDAIVEEWKRCRDAEIDFEAEYTITLPSNERIKVHSTAIQLKSVSGLLIGFVGKTNKI